MNNATPPERLVENIEKIRKKAPDGLAESDYSVLSNALKDFYDLRSSCQRPGPEWDSLVGIALRLLGSFPLRVNWNLDQYDSNRFGPFLGVSNEGVRADEISDAASSSPKALSLGTQYSPLTVGVAVDVERLASAGEMPPSAEDLFQVWKACAGRSLMTTNVSSRVNVRLYKTSPVVDVTVDNSKQNLQAAYLEITKHIDIFHHAPGGSRELCIAIRFPNQLLAEGELSSRAEFVDDINAFIVRDYKGDAEKYKIALQVDIDANNALESGRNIRQGIELASQNSGIKKVVIGGQPRSILGEALPLPGMLNFLEPEPLKEILDFSSSKGVDLNTAQQIDLDAVTNQIWMKLNTIRGLGFSMGKYGLFPLNLEECDYVIGRIQNLFPDWQATPAVYVDQGILSTSKYYSGNELVDGIKRWLSIVAGHRVRLVLIDTVEKSKGWKLLQWPNGPRGFVSIDQLADIQKYAESLGIRPLWAGGISALQARELSTTGVFGIYVTSSVSEPVPVFGVYERDPGLASVKAPTRKGVLELKKQMEAGYLHGKLKEMADFDAQNFIKNLENAERNDEDITGILENGWSVWWQYLDRNA